MKAFFSLFALLIAFMLLLSLEGCGEKPKEEHSSQTSSVSTPKHPVAVETNSSPPQTEIKARPDDTLSFALQDHNGSIRHIASENGQLAFNDTHAKIVVLNFFNPRSQPCQGQAPSLNMLQNKYAGKLLLIGILLHPAEQLSQLDTFIRQNDAYYFIATGSDNDRFLRHILAELKIPDIFPVPLTVIYKNGIYFRHYEGAVPYEMIEHDIQTIIEQ